MSEKKRRNKMDAAWRVINKLEAKGNLSPADQKKVNQAYAVIDQLS